MTNTTKFVENFNKFSAVFRYKNNQANVIDFPDEWKNWDDDKIYAFLRGVLINQNLNPDNMEINYSITIKEL